MNHILSTSLAVPKRKIPNSYFNELYQKDVDIYLRQKRNIFTRYFLSEGESIAGLAADAAHKAIDNAHLHSHDIDLIIVATDTPDSSSPSMASRVQNSLQAKKAGTFDVNSACAGFVTALDVASSMLDSHTLFQYALVVGVYGMSRFIDSQDYKSLTTFADGAGAVILKKSNEKKSSILDTLFFTDGAFAEKLGIYNGKLFLSSDISSEFNEREWPRMIRSLLDKNNIHMDEIKYFLFTQLSYESILTVMKSLNQSLSKTHFIMDRYGYTGSACLPMCLADLNSEGRLKSGDKIVLMASGGGLSMACMLLEWRYDIRS